MNLAQIIYMPVMYLNCVFEIYLFYIFLEAAFPVYEDRKIVKAFEIMGCITLIYTINSLKNPAVNLIGVPLILLIFARLVFRIEFKYNILYVICFYAILAIIEFIFHYIYKLLVVDITTANFNMVLLLIIQAVSRFVVIQVLIRHHWKSHDQSSDSYQYLKSLFILPIATLILLNGFLTPIRYEIGYLLICIGGILLIVSFVLDFCIVEKLLKAVNATKDAEMLLLKTQLEKNYYQRLEEINQDYAKYMHEMKHMIRTIEQLACIENNDSIKALAEEISMKGYPPVRKYYSGNRITDAIFIEREKKARDLGVEYHMDIQPGLILDFIDNMDKISMFGNLLDNALEAASANDEGYVSASLCWGNNSFVIFKVENNFKIKAQKDGKRYLTIKHEKGRHGFGIQNVEELSKKYGGMLNIIEDENTFTAVLLLSNMQSVQKMES